MADNNGVIVVELRYIQNAQAEFRKDLARHYDDDAELQKRIWERLHTLDNLRWWVMGVAAVVVVVSSILWSIGSHYLQLQVSAIVSEQVKTQTAATMSGLENKIDHTVLLIEKALNKK